MSSQDRTPEQLSFDSTLKELIAGREIGFAGAEAAMRSIMAGEVSQAKLAAWLVALRIKGESPSEIAGCAKAMKAESVKFAFPSPDALDTCGTGGDGLHTINVSTGAAFVAAGAGVKIAKHGNKAVSSKSGSADVLEALGVNIAVTPERAARILEKTGIAFLFAPSFHPAMRHAAPVRKELGVRTVFNILGPLTNPAGAKKAVLGVYSDSLCRKMAEAAKEIGFERMMAVHGADGLDEISVSGPTRICELRDGAVLDYMISPEEFGLELSEISDIAGGSPQDNARMLKEILSGELRGAKRDIVALNAAAAILVYGAADSWASALAKAEESIDSGAASGKLEELARQSNA